MLNTRKYYLHYNNADGFHTKEKYINLNFNPEINEKKLSNKKKNQQAFFCRLSFVVPFFLKKIYFQASKTKKQVYFTTPLCRTLCQKFYCILKIMRHAQSIRRHHVESVSPFQNNFNRF